MLSAKGFSVTLLFMISGCAATPYDFPTPTMYDGHPAYAMTGNIKGSTDDAVRDRLKKWTACKQGLEILTLHTERADTPVTPVMKYDAIVRCTDGQRPFAR